MKTGSCLAPGDVCNTARSCSTLAPASFFTIFAQLPDSSLLFNSNLSSPSLLPLALKISVSESLPRLTGFWGEQENLPSPVDVNTHSRLGTLQLQEQTQRGFFFHKRLIWDIHTVPAWWDYRHLLNVVICNRKRYFCPHSTNNAKQLPSYFLFSSICHVAEQVFKSKERGRQQCCHFVHEALTIFPFLGPNGPTARQNYT